MKSNTCPTKRWFVAAAALLIVAALPLAVGPRAVRAADNRPFALPFSLVHAPVVDHHGVYRSTGGALTYSYSADTLYGVGDRALVYTVTIHQKNAKAASALSLTTLQYIERTVLNDDPQVSVGRPESVSFAPGKVVIWSIEENTPSTCAIAYGWNIGTVSGTVTAWSYSAQDCSWETAYAVDILNALVRAETAPHPA